MTDKIIHQAAKRLKSEGVVEKLTKLGKPLFLVISGSHGFGYASESSDVDVRGVYIAPTKKFLGMRRIATEPTFEYMSQDRMLDVSVDEVGHYINVVERSNGERVEWPSSRLLLAASPEYIELRDIINSAGLSKRQAGYYVHLPRDIRAGKKPAKGIKGDIYAMRTYLAGIMLFEQGRIMSDISDLGRELDVPTVDELINLKKQGTEYDPRKFERVFNELDSRLIRAIENSSLPDRPDIDKLNKYLVELRKQY